MTAIVFLGSALASLLLFLTIADIWFSRPIVTKDPTTGKMRVPRSDLTIGEGRKHHS